MSTTTYLSKTELRLLTNINKNNVLKDINYFLWINKSNLENPYVFIDTIELEFETGLPVFFKINENDTGINLLNDFDFEATKKEVTELFNGLITLKKINALEFPVWKDVLKSEFVAIKSDLEKEGYANNYFEIVFKKNTIAINYHPSEGLQITLEE